MTGGLRRDLGLWAAVSVVVGSMIGVGIFLGPRVIAEHLPTPGLVMLAWVLGGLFVFTGALTYAEMGAAFPESGGIYAYMREAFGPGVAFLAGWSGFAVGKAASVAALAVGFTEFLGMDGGAALGVASLLILALAAVNVVGVRYAGWLAVVTGVVKVGAIALLVVLGAAVLGGRIPALAEDPLLPAGSSFTSILPAFGLALIPVFFAYDGWVNSTQVAEEVRDPARNVPRSVILGTLAVVAAYALINLTYLLALGPERVGESGAAANTADVLIPGGWGGTLVVGAILVSIVGTINAVTLSGPRIAFAMARDGSFFRNIDRVNRFGTPGAAIALQTGISLALVALPPIGDEPLFDTLLTYIIVDSFVFYGLGACAVFVLRRKHPDRPRPYRVPLYPVVPLVFVAGSALFVLNALVTMPAESIAGLAIVLAGLPIYLYWRAKNGPRRLSAVRWETRAADETDGTPPAK